MPLGLVELALQVTLAIHAARTGRMQPWLWIILFLPGIGSLLYIAIELVPEWSSGRAGRSLSAKVTKTIAPGRVYRDLARQVEIAPTVHNKLALAAECLNLGRPAEAIQLYESCATGLHATEPAIRTGLARARYAAGDYAGTIAELDALRRDTPDHRTADGHLLYALALDGEGRTTDALAEFHSLAQYAPGEEARCRYAELLARVGAPQEAQTHFQEIVRRVDLQGSAYRRTHRNWYDTARRALSAPTPNSRQSASAAPPGSPPA